MAFAARRHRIAAFVFTAYLILPAFLIASLAWQPPSTDGWLPVFTTAAVVGFLFTVGAWGWLGLPVRWALVVALIAEAAYRDGLIGAAAVLAIIVAMHILSLGRAGRVPRSAVAVALDPPFPLGGYLIGQGGASARFNHHFRSRAQRYALDIERLGWWGTRCRGLYPAQLDRYCIFGVTVLSPCDGVVTFVDDRYRDEIPPSRNRTALAGNLVIIALDGCDVLVGLAHLQSGSITVRAGERVRSGQPLARVGNSGNSTEPHLHLQAKRGGSPTSLLDGEGVPMRIGGRFLRRNHLFRGRQPAYTEHHVPQTCA